MVKRVINPAGILKEHDYETKEKSSRNPQRDDLRFTASQYGKEGEGRCIRSCVNRKGRTGG